MKTFAEYAAEIQRTWGKTASSGFNERSLTIFGLGVAGEAGEVADLIKKHVGHGHDFDRAKLTKELGDVLWYVAALAELCGVPFEDVAAANVAKLRARYPTGFDPKRSQNREAES